MTTACSYCAKSRHWIKERGSGLEVISYAARSEKEKFILSLSGRFGNAEAVFTENQKHSDQFYDEWSCPKKYAEDNNSQ